MLDKNFIEEKINNMFEEKGYDKRAKTMLSAFFINFADKYELTEEQFISALETYKRNINEIGFHNVGTDNYLYSNRGYLVFDKDALENLDEANFERVFKTFIKGNIRGLFGNNSQNCNDLVETAAIVTLYDKPDELSSDIISLVAGAFDIDRKQVITLYEDARKGEDHGRETKNNHEFGYYNTSRILIPSISEKLGEISQGKISKETFKVILGLCLLNINVKCNENLVDEKTPQNYAKFLNVFKKYQELLQIQDSELGKICLDDRSWVIDGNSILTKLEERFPNMPEIETPGTDKHISRIDRQEIIKEQQKYVSKEFPTITDIETRVNKLIEEKSYPKEFHSLLMEFFKRNAIDFEWDIETLDNKIENLRINIDSFRFVPKKSLHGASAKYNFTDKTIDFTSANAFTSNFNIATTAMHELEHATADTKRNGIDIEDHFSRGENTTIHAVTVAGLDELITESSTIVTEGKNPYSDKYATTFKLTSGYSEFSGTISMISASLGMSEKEFLRLANKCGKKTVDVLETKYPGLNISQKFDELNDELTYLHASSALGIPSADAYAEVYNILNEIYENRIAIDKQKPDFDPLKARYDEYKLNKNMLTAKRKLYLSRKELSKRIDNYDLISQKARIRPEERAAFEKFGTEIIQEIPIRDNRILLESGAKIKGFKATQQIEGQTSESIWSKIITRIKSSFQKRLPPPKTSNEPKIPPKGPVVKTTTYTTEEVNPWKVDVDLSQASKKSNEQQPHTPEQEVSTDDDDTRFN